MCIDAGGTTRLTAKLRFENGEYFTVNLASLEMARQLGARLHEWVGLEGEAKWNSENWGLESFKVTKITEYYEIDIVRAFNGLSDAAGDAWDEVDPEEYVQDLRAD